MTQLRLLASLTFVALSLASPAFAEFGTAQATGRMAPPESCSYDQARAALSNGRMTVLADVPRTNGAYRFVVKWKGQIDGASVSVFTCDVDIAVKAALRQPWCAYIPGDRLQCPTASAAQ